MSSNVNSDITKSDSLNSSSSPDSNVRSSPKKKPMEPPSQRPPYLDENGMIVPALYYRQPFFTRRPKLVNKDTVLPNLNDDADNEYLIFPVHGEIGRLLSSGELVPALPYPWIELIDSTRGYPYYANTETKEITWVKPVADPALPYPWIELFDSTRGYPYYANTETKESTWVKPVADPAFPNSNGIKKIEQPDEQRQINHYLRVIEISNPHQPLLVLDKKSIFIKLHDKLTSSSKKRFFSTSSQGKQDRQNFFKEIKPFLSNPDPSVDSVHLVDITHDRIFSGHSDITAINNNVKINVDLLTTMEYMGLLKPIRPVELDKKPKITDMEKDVLETFHLYADSLWIGSPDGVNIDRISLFDNILSLAQHMNKRLNIVIFSCSGPLDPYNIQQPSTQSYFYKKSNIERPLSMYIIPINILKTGCDFINRMEHILHNIISVELLYSKFLRQYYNNDNKIKILFNGITELIRILFSNGLYQTITSEFSIDYIDSELLSFQYNGENIFESRLNIDDFELLTYATKVYLSEEICKHLIGLIEHVIDLVNTDIKETTEYIVQNKSSEIWNKTLPSLGLRNQVFNDEEHVGFFSSVGHAVEYLFVHLSTFSNSYLKMLLVIFKAKKALIHAAQTSLKISKSRSRVANTIGYKAVKLANERRVVFENLVKKHCSHHYKYKSRTPNDGIVKNRSTRSYRPESMRRRQNGKIRNDTDPQSPTSSAIRSAEEKRNADPLYAKRDTISRNRRVKKALQQLNEPLNDKIIGVLGRDQKERNMSKGRIERNEPGGVFMTNRLHAFGDMLSKETRKKRIYSRGKASRSSRSSRNRINHSV